MDAVRRIGRIRAAQTALLSFVGARIDRPVRSFWRFSGLRAPATGHPQGLRSTRGRRRGELTMDAWVWVVIIALVVIVVAAVAVAAMRSRRTDRLREDFGPEYDRALREREGDRSRAEAELLGRRDRRDALDIRPLSPSAADGYRDRWRGVQSQFVDEPAAAVGAADGLLTEVMRDRGYPVDDFAAQEELMSVNHPEVVEDYREGHRIHTAYGSGDASTEDLRQAMVHFRGLFERLVGAGQTADIDHVRGTR